MTHHFDESALAGVLGHMNGDHGDDNILIARAFGPDGVIGAVMTGFDGDGGTWSRCALRGRADRSPGVPRCGGRSSPCTTRRAAGSGWSRGRTPEVTIG